MVVINRIFIMLFSHCFSFCSATRFRAQHLHARNLIIPTRQAFILPTVRNGRKMPGTVSLWSAKVTWYVEKQLDNQLRVQKIFSRQEEPITSNWSELWMIYLYLSRIFLHRILLLCDNFTLKYVQSLKKYSLIRVVLLLTGIYVRLD